MEFKEISLSQKESQKEKFFNQTGIQDFPKSIPSKKRKIER